MSDRSSSDMHNRNIVKNPLLSSAVTGLSFEDLTHNAVLLPVAASPGVIPSQDVKAQNPNMGVPSPVTHNIPSGDASLGSKHTLNIHQNPTLHTLPPLDKSQSMTTVSNASTKTNDDFDVNEYFARLQGTRYVSAPLNSHLKEDNNANLQTEDNLEEINLNDTDRIEDPQQSITADIAQNFSQLPTVLPQVASAVFSSFSNMLSMKSREQTPEELRMKQEVLQKREMMQSDLMSVPMMGTQELSAAPREMAPPLKEPPMMSGSGNFRITTKKKAYAQIPGLSSKDPPSMTAFNPPSMTASNSPSYFVPNIDNSASSSEVTDSIGKPPSISQAQSVPNITQTSQTQLDNSNPASYFNPTSEVTMNPVAVPQTSNQGSLTLSNFQDSFAQTNSSIQIGISANSSVQIPSSNANPQAAFPIANITAPIGFPPAKSVQTNPILSPVEPNSETSQMQSPEATISQEPSTSIIPPPPMFTNLPRKVFVEYQSNVGKSVLPPSVARRIASNQPIIKQNVPTAQVSHDNIFVPAPIMEQVPDSTQLMASSTIPSQTILKPIEANIPTEKQIEPPPTFYSRADYVEPTAPSSDNTDRLNAYLPQQGFENVPSSTNHPSLQLTQTSVVPANVPPPTFFNVNTLPTSTVLQTPDAFAQGNQSTDTSATNLLEPAAPEPPKPSIPLPPKNTANQSYRLTKKRPQYYSGPIEGMGSISNNIKPVMPPAASSSFQGAMFAPEISTSNLGNEGSFAPFDLSKPVETPISADINVLSQPQSQINPPTNYSYNTAFDLSRPTTDSFAPPKDEPKGFGIIGSLKSKLSSIDINKLQDKVTTFFDPAYNAPKPEAENIDQTYRLLQNPQETYSQNQASNFEIFVPANQQEYPTNYGYGYPTTEYSNYNQNLPTQYYEVQNANNFNTQSYYTNTENNPNKYQQTQELYTAPTLSANYLNQPLHETTAITEKNTDLNLLGSSSNDHQPSIPNVAETAQQTTESEITQQNQIDAAQSTQEILTPASSFFDTNLQSTDIIHSFSNLQITQDSISVEHYVTEKNQSTDNFTATLLFDSPKSETKKSEEVSQKVSKTNLFFDKSVPAAISESSLIGSRQNVSTEVSDVSLFELSSMIADRSSEDQTHQTPDEVDEVVNLRKYGSIEKVTDLNICETCREVNKPEDKDDVIDDLTTQLIENITSPIQLLNPVEVPLTEHNSPVDVNTEIDQLKQISDITEDTMETIQVQAENDARAPVGEINNYGWATTETSCPSNILKEPNFDFQVNPETIGLLGSTSLFLNVPTNASDEIKAELKYTTDDNISIPEIPSAPQLEDDTQPDDHLDVQSIELDAKNDFPVFEGEEFVIEPSETDDDKIEFIEGRRKSSVDQDGDFDSFTNRVDKYKKMEGSHEGTDTSNSQILGATSPVITIASYFDTGNYAVETHYRNSLTSPPTMTFNVGSPNLPMSIPPGFEEEFKRRLSGLSSHESFTPFLQKNLHSESQESSQNLFAGISEDAPNQDAVSVPETQTQTYQAATTTYSHVQQFTDIGFQPKLDWSGCISVPETQTQTYQTATTTYNLAHNLSTSVIGTTAFLPKNELVSVPGVGVISPVIKNTAQLFDISQSFDEPEPEIPLIPSDLMSEIQNPSISETVKKPKESIPAFNDVFGKKENILLKESEFVTAAKTVQETNVPGKLLDPINFFSSTSSSAKEDTADTGFNRLASYFASPAKTEPSKSFFELSQSQNHYRHVANTNVASENSKNNKSFFELTQSENHYREPKINLQDIPHDQYIANLNLMKDLTSPANADFSKSDHIVRTVNYFSVDYDIVDFKNLNSNECKPKPLGSLHPENKDYENHKEKRKKTNDIKEKPEETKPLHDDLNSNETDDPDIETVVNILENCKYCCEYLKLDKLSLNDVKSKEFKVRKSMNTESDSQKDMAKAPETVPTTTINSVTVNLTGFPYDESNEGVAVDHPQNTPIGQYTPVKHHWFYRVDADGKRTWKGFSTDDSKALEDALEDPNLNESTTVPTDGGRFDVNVMGRLRTPVYWTDKPTNVRRCSWFYKGTTDARYVPYSEDVAIKLEEEYRQGVLTGTWHRCLCLPNNEAVVMHAATYMVHRVNAPPTDGYTTPTAVVMHAATYMVHRVNAPPTDGYTTPTLMSSVFNKRVYRNPPKIKVIKNEHEKIDYLILLVHGAGEYKKQREKHQSVSRDIGVRRGCSECSIEDAAPSSVQHLLLLCHGVGSACDLRFRSVEEVVDDFRTTSQQLLQAHYKNSYDNGIVGRVEVLPISWHTTLHSGEKGVDRRLAQITLDSIPRLRNFTNDTVLDVLFYTSPVFCQTILDTVCSEMNRIYRIFKSRNPEFKGGVSLGGHSLGSVILYDLLCHQKAKLPSNLKGKTFVGGGHSLNIDYPQLEFEPDTLYAMGSPIAIFECIRGVESLGLDFALPTCKHFFNIFHPNDPIAYRIEPLVNPNLKNVKPFLIPHHKGRKRMHLELKDTMSRVGADIKQKIVESLRATWASVWRTAPAQQMQLEKVVEEELEKEHLVDPTPTVTFELTESSDLQLGLLNAGRRVDHVLQEAPLEMINEYLFAMSSHVCYWESEDTILLILREIYDSLGVHPDCTVPQQTMQVHRTRKDDCLNKPEYPSTSRDPQ